MVLICKVSCVKSGHSRYSKPLNNSGFELCKSIYMQIFYFFLLFFTFIKSSFGFF